MRPLASRSRRAGALGAVALASAAVAALVALAASSCDMAVSLSNLQGGCVPPKHGATQVKITSGASPYCIDSTETTNAQYAQFVQANHTLPANLPAGCEGATDPTPSAGFDPTYPSGEDSFPVVNVSWCQAYAYCEWSGKRLCGAIGGGPLAAVNEFKPQYGQWLNACSLDGKLIYPYGDTFSSGTCGGQVDGSASSLDSVPVTSCVGSVPGLYDMSGSVWEWTDACDPPPDPPVDGGAANVFCYTMGGAYNSLQPDELACTGERNWTRTSPAGNIGIRCCTDL
jgi:sulfatase modifying factor 1